MESKREVDLRGNCSKCGGVHFGTGPDCVYGKPVQNSTVPIPPTLQGGREQPQGEATRCERTGNLCGSDTWMEGHSCPCKQCQAWLVAQTEGGEKPQVCRNPNHFHTDGSPSEHEIGSSCMAEPSSPPAQPAGGAREFLDNYQDAWVLSISERGKNAIAAVCEAYADQRVRQERERYANALVEAARDLEKLRQELAKIEVEWDEDVKTLEELARENEGLRQERDALKKEMTLAENSDGAEIAAIVGPILREIYGETVELGHYKAAIAAWRHGRSGTLTVMGMFGREREARERAEKALRRLRNEVYGLLNLSEQAMRDAAGNTNVNCLLNRITEADSVLTALASLKSSEGAKEAQ